VCVCDCVCVCVCVCVCLCVGGMINASNSSTCEGFLSIYCHEHSCVFVCILLVKSFVNILTNCWCEYFYVSKHGWCAYSYVFAYFRCEHSFNTQGI